jgi:predicted acetyltransferase
MDIKLYNQDFLEKFNEHLRDNFDSHIEQDIETTYDELLLKYNVKRYEELLKEFIAEWNYYAAPHDMVDDLGYKLPKNDEQIIGIM